MWRLGSFAGLKRTAPVLAVSLLAAATPSPVEGASGAGSASKERAARPYFDVSMTGSEIDGPLPQGDYDTDLFRGLGLAFEAGARIGAWRVGGAVHGHYADNSLMGYVVGDNTVSFTAVTANGWRDVPVSKRFGIYFGAGVGVASVDVRYSGYESDPAYEDYWDARSDRTVAAGHLATGFWFDPTGTHRARLHVGFRWTWTADLDLVDTLGRSFSKDAVEMPMAILGFTWVPRGRADAPIGSPLAASPSAAPGR